MDGYADVEFDVKFPVTEQERLLEGFEHPLGDLDGDLEPGIFRYQDQELLLIRQGDDIGFPQGARDTVRNGLYHRIDNGIAG